MSEEKKMETPMTALLPCPDIVERAKNEAQACHRPLVHPSDNSRIAATLLDCADEIERLRRPPSPVGRDLGGSGSALGGPSSTPSDALEAAQRIVDFNPLHGDWDDAMCEDAEAVARALLAASPSPWREMEEKEMARAENARGSVGETPSDDATHDWFTPDFIPHECCRKCGIVRRRDRKNKACKGVVRVGLR